MDGGALIILGIILYILMPKRTRRRSATKPTPKQPSLIRTWIIEREKTNAKRALARDREQRAERKKRKEANRLRRADGKLNGSWWHTLID